MRPHLQVTIPDGLIDALRHQRQIDMDGTEVGVSRQACDEAAQILSAVSAALAPTNGTMTETAEMQAKPVAWRWRYDQRFAWHIGILELSDGIRNIAEVEPLYSQSDFDAMRAQRDEARAQLATLQAQITRLREALKPFAEAYKKHDDPGVSDLDNEQPISWHVPLGAFRRARAALSEPSPSNSGDTP